MDTTAPRTTRSGRLPLNDPRRTSEGAPLAAPLFVQPPGGTPTRFGTPEETPAAPVPIEIDPDSDFFADPDATKRLDEEYGLPRGHWIEVHATLSWGQELKLQSSIIGERVNMATMGAGGAGMSVDWTAAMISKIVVWVVAWSFKYKGQVLPVTVDNIRGMRPEVAALVNQAVDRHVEEVQRGKATPPSSPGSMPA